jgi:hypothetical protein
MVLRLFPLHCYIQTESNTARLQLCARGIRGKRLIEGKAGHCSDYLRNCVRFRQGIERGYRSENGVSVGMKYEG